MDEITEAFEIDGEKYTYTLSRQELHRANQIFEKLPKHLHSPKYRKWAIDEALKELRPKK